MSSGATSYRVQVSTNSGFTSTLVDQGGITATSYGVSGLSPSTLYYWRVNATNSAGTSSWSSARSFTTLAAVPAAPTLSSPSNGATGVATSPTLSWNASSGATSYRVLVSTKWDLRRRWRTGWDHSDVVRGQRSFGQHPLLLVCECDELSRDEQLVQCVALQDRRCGSTKRPLRGF